MDGDNLIQGRLYLKKLLSIRSQLLVKPVRFLTQSHVEPNNLEKMKVSRATQVFSPVVIATLEFLQENPQCHPDATEFQDCLPIITFMKMVSKWYDLHNIGAVKPRGQREEPFCLIDDDRLSWLEVDFITYIEEIQLSGGKTKKKMTKETCEATIMTTRSTVALIQHLLDNNFRYVLTRALNSDPVESLFSCFRQFNRGNDRVDARTAVFTAEKLLKVGILQAAKSGNAPHSSETNAPLKLKAQEGNTAAVPLAVVLGAKRLSYELEVLNVWLAVPDNLELAPLVYLAGYIARACEEKVRTVIFKLCIICCILSNASLVRQPVLNNVHFTFAFFNVNYNMRTSSSPSFSYFSPFALPFATKNQGQGSRLTSSEEKPGARVPARIRMRVPPRRCATTVRVDTRYAFAL
ncbi:uncharacterized protein LOC142765629 isoform X2 [Rhipicephalus microplus]|uniref:uncharacterized protein LOC142765629 isoform X2 n=1 Tax=Rhipicephalus microplus TaxID=6941 RepID=UPI003F6D5D84